MHDRSSLQNHGPPGSPSHGVIDEHFRARTGDKTRIFINAVALVNIAVVCSVALSMLLMRTHAAASKRSALTECEDVSVAAMLHALIPATLGGSGQLLEATRQLWACAEQYRAADEAAFTLAFSAIYVLLQAFAIPGPIILSMIAGAMWGPVKSQLIVALCATVGATLCFTISAACAGPIVRTCMPKRVSSLRRMVTSQRGNLLWYMLFLRITPACPNWLVNVASPLVGVPLPTFIAATLVGLIPANYFHTQTGATLMKLGGASMQDNMSPLLTLIALQFLALAPTLLSRFVPVRTA